MENVCHYLLFFHSYVLYPSIYIYERGVCEDNWGCMHNVFH